MECIYKKLLNLQGLKLSDKKEEDKVRETYKLLSEIVTNIINNWYSIISKLLTNNQIIYTILKLQVNVHQFEFEVISSDATRIVYLLLLKV